MKIPKGAVERDAFYEDVIGKCLASADNRSIDYSTMRHYYLFGRGPEEQEETPYNKVYPHIDTLVAFLFASETTKFSIHLPANASEQEHDRIPVLNRAVNDAWLYSNADHVFSQAITWSLVYGTTLVKLIGRGAELNPFIVDPASFGVLREDIPYLDRQEAMVHSYFTTRSQLEVDIADHPDKDKIIASMSYSPGRPDDRPSGVEKIMLSASTPTMTGNVNISLNENIDYRAKVEEDLVQLYELWIWDTDEGDYRVVTRSENGMTIYDRPNFFLKGEHPFIHVCPNPLYSYFWGMSEVVGLSGLQKWRNERTIQIKKLLDQQVSPPTAMTGWQGLLEEKHYAMFSEGGMLSTDSPQAKVDRFAPQIPTDIFNVVHEIDAMFAERSGLQNIMMGKGESGVRSGRQTSELARLGSARTKKRALVIEDALEKIVTTYLKYMRKYDKRDYLDEKGLPFIAEQFSSEFVVKVDAHSNSPLFIEDQKSLAGEMLQAHAIDRESFLDILDPPNKDILKRKLKEIEKKEAEAQKQQAQAEAQGKQ